MLVALLLIKSGKLSYTFLAITLCVVMLLCLLLHSAPRRILCVAAVAGECHSRFQFALYFAAVVFFFFMIARTCQYLLVVSV